MVPLVAVFSVADRKRILAIAVVLAVPAITAKWINQFRPDLVPPAVFLFCALLLLAFVDANLLRFNLLYVAALIAPVGFTLFAGEIR